MVNNFKLDELLSEPKCASIIKGNYIPMNNIYYLTEDDVSQSFDNRVLESYVEDIDGGDNFSDYVKYFFDTYGKEVFDY